MELAKIGGDILWSAIANGTLLEQIPGVSVVSAGLDAFNTIRADLFREKLLSFLEGAEEASDEEKKRFVEDADSRVENGELLKTMLMILEQADSAEKGRIIGRLLAARIDGKLSEVHTRRLASIVSRVFLDDLILLRTFKGGPQGEQTPTAESLHAANLLSNSGFDDGTPEGGGGVVYTMNEYGRMLLAFGLSRE